MSNQFEENVKAIPSGDQERLWKKALIEVADTAWLCQSWFTAHGVTFAAADLLLMTRMVLDREEAMRLEEAMQDDE